MRRGFGLLLLLTAGCRSAEHVPQIIEAQVAAVAPVKAEATVQPCSATVPVVDGPTDLYGFWGLALEHNPSLREASAEVEAARGKRVQSGKYPNPRVGYMHDAIGTSMDPAGNLQVTMNQEILTAGKRRLDMEAADRNLDARTVALLGRKFEILTRVRRAWYDYVSLAYALQVNREVVASLEQNVEITRKLVEDVKTRPKTDLLRLQALLEQARINQTRTQANLDAAWKQLVAEVGVPQMGRPSHAYDLPNAVPLWAADAVTARVLAVHSDLRQVSLEAERARLEFERARAEAVPNVTVGGGWTRAFADQMAGGVVTVETAIPVWDRKQGFIHEMRARWSQAQAAERTTANRLSRDAAEAFARYEGARQQVEKLTTMVLPKLEENLKLVREGYQAGAMGLGFADVQLAVEALNEARLKLADTRRELWRAIADLQGLMQLDIQE